MSRVDVACAGAIFLDLTFAGMDGVPRPGEERWAEDLLLSPGGMANTAVGLARLGLNTAVVSPIGRDLAGRYIRSALEAEGVACLGPQIARSAVTAVLPVSGDRALVSFEPKDAGDADGLAQLAPRAAVLLLDQLAYAPADAWTYAVTSHAHVRGEATALAERLHRSIQIRAVIANEAEALALTGTARAELAARALSERVETAVVTLGAEGALAATRGASLERVPASRSHVCDVTGAGDLFVAAYVWADLHGLPLRDRLRWATLYASLSVGTVTAFAGAARLGELVAAGRLIGLEAPPQHSAPSTQP